MNKIIFCLSLASSANLFSFVCPISYSKVISTSNIQVKQSNDLQDKFVKFLLNSNYNEALNSLVCSQTLINLSWGVMHSLVNPCDENYIDLIYSISKVFRVHPVKVAMDLYKIGFISAPKALLNFERGANKFSLNLNVSIEEIIARYTYFIQQKIFNFKNYADLKTLTQEFNFLISYRALKEQMFDVF